MLRRVGADAAGWLAPGGHLVVEAGTTQVDTLCAAFEEAGLVPTVHHDEDLDATAIARPPPLTRVDHGVVVPDKRHDGCSIPHHTLDRRW